MPECVYFIDKVQAFLAGKDKDMSETALNQSGMYGTVAAIQELNRVEGFEPRNYMRQLAGDGQTAKYYLDVVYRKLWFRLKYPNGKIVKTLKKLTDQVAIVEARVYLDRNDPEDSFISNALAQKYMTADDQFGNKYVELAETAAVGRALADAGFGLQFADLEGEVDPNIVDAGLEHMTGAEEMKQTPAENPGIPAQDGNDSGAGMMNRNAASSGYSGNLPPAMPRGQGRTSQAGASSQEKPSGGPVSKPSGVRAMPSVQERLAGLKRDLPVEQLCAALDRELAEAVVISVGAYRNKTMGQLALEKPQALNWYLRDYKGPDNLIRAAAQVLLNAAFAA